jgi:hypothetical protein
MGRLEHVLEVNFGYHQIYTLDFFLKRRYSGLNTRTADIVEMPIHTVLSRWDGRAADCDLKRGTRTARLRDSVKAAKLDVGMDLAIDRNSTLSLLSKTQDPSDDVPGYHFCQIKRSPSF